ncbi:hypothetical protein [Psychroserpens sp. MEBiC05023]
MDWSNIIIGIISILVGVIFINYYFHLKRKKETVRMSIKGLSAGYGLIIIGIGLIIKEFFGNY